MKPTAPEMMARRKNLMRRLSKSVRHAARMQEAEASAELVKYFERKERNTHDDN